MAKWIMVVDDDTANLQMAGHILSKNNMRVTALKSGRAMLDYVKEKGAPDLILLDIKMPEMDGFESLKHLKELEKEMGINEIPVIFLTADENTGTESRGFEEGVADFIRKPFNPDVLLKRIDNVISMQKEMLNLKSEATLDKLTGFLNKAATTVELSKACSTGYGALLMIDLDSFKLVNDIYGHEMGDKVLISFARIIEDTVPKGSKNGRIGGDEFVSFCVGVDSDEEVADITKQLNEKLLKSAKEMMGDDMSIPLGTSVGASFVPKHGNDYASLLKLSDKCLYVVKKNGKHGYSVYSTDAFAEDELTPANMDIKSISEILGERNVSNVALQLDMDAFSYVYRYATRYFVRNNINMCKVLYTLDKVEGTSDEQYRDACDEFGNHLRESMRKSDILTRSRYNQYYVILTDIREEFINKVIDEIIKRWNDSLNTKLKITYETEFVRNEGGRILEKGNKHVVIVDDDEMSLQYAKKLIEEEGIKTTVFRSGNELLDYVSAVEILPDLILLDINMPEKDGYETYEAIQKFGEDASRTAVIFLSAESDDGAEIKGLSMGAMDFIRKPFIPGVLKLRVNHTLELVMLRKRFHKGRQEQQGDK